MFEFGLAPLLYACSLLYIHLPARFDDLLLVIFCCRFVPHAHRILHVTSGCPSVRQCREYGTFRGVCGHFWSVERVPLGADAGGGGDRPSFGQVSDSFLPCSAESLLFVAMRSHKCSYCLPAVLPVNFNIDHCNANSLLPQTSVPALRLRRGGVEPNGAVSCWDTVPCRPRALRRRDQCECLLSKAVWHLGAHCKQSLYLDEWLSKWC